MGNCRECGEIFDERAKFCSNCGQKLKGQEVNTRVVPSEELIPVTSIKKISILNFFANTYLLFAVGFLYLTITRGLIFICWIFMLTTLGLTLKILHHNSGRKEVSLFHRKINKNFFGFCGVAGSVALLYLVHYILQIFQLI